MAVNIELKRSAVPGKVPTTGSINLGEIAINTYDGKAYFKKKVGAVESIIELASTSGSILSASYALSSSFATTASYSNTSTSASYALSASYTFNATSASYALFATSASYAATASSADNFLVRGTLTAQTIVAQTITSSTDFVTGSTRFGTQLTDTHQFTGSVTITGSLAVNGSDYTTTSASFNTRILNNSSSISYLSGSFLSASASFDTRITNNSASISYLSSSYLASSASFDTRITNNSASISYLSSSYLVSSASFDTRITNNSSSISYLSGSFLNASASFDTRITNNSSSISYLSSSYLASSASFDTRITNNSASISALSQSFSAFTASYNTGSFIGQFTGSFSGSLNNLQGSPRYIPFFSSSQLLNNSAIYQVGTSSIAINEVNVTTANPEVIYAFQTHPTSINVITGKGNLNNYLQNNIQNTNQGVSASSDVVATANNGDESSFYIDMGINSQNYSQNFIGAANDAYLYAIANDLHIGNAAPNKPLQFFVGGTDVDIYNKLQLNPDNRHLMSGSLDVSGSIKAQSFTGSLLGTASFANNATSASYALTASYVANASSFPFTGSAIISGSLIVTGSTISTNGFTGSLLGTASFANNATSASFALSASQAQNATTASYVLQAVSASFASTASSVNQLNQSVVVSGSLTVSGSTSLVGSTGTTLFSANADTLTFTGSIFTSGSIVSTGSLNITSVTSSLFGTASFANNATSASFAITSSFASTASFVQNAVSASFASTASYVLNAVSSSFATTASSADNFTVRGTLTAQTIVAQTITSSTEFVTGSTKFGTLLSNTHQFTGSVSITGSLGINGVDYAATSASFDTRITNNSASISTLSSSFLNASASFDTRITNNSSSIASLSSSYLASSASFDTRITNNSASISALSSSFLNASASFDTRIFNNSSSIATLSSSFLAFSASYNTGSFTGSFIGNLIGTASWANNATTASYALNATSASFAATASTAQDARNILVYVKNSSGAQIDKGKVVRISGAVGDNPLIATASYTDDNNSANTLGVTYQDIPNDDFGYVITEGTLLGVNTSTFTAGQLIYLGATGSITGSAPVAPLHAVRLGEVLRVQLNNGSIYVRIDNGYELGELHDVRDTTTTGSYGDLLVKSGSIWINAKQLTGSYGLTGSLNTSGSNTFIGNQIVTGSLFTTGSNTLIGSTTLTGSLNITGSTTQVGNNNLLGNTTLSGSIIISGSTTTPTVQVYGNITHDGYVRFNPVSTNIDQSISASYIYVSGSTNDLYFSQNGSGYSNTTRLRWLEGNLYTGLLHGGIISATTGSTIYTISSGSGIIVNLNASFNNDPYPTIKFITWPNLTASIAPLSASYDQSFVAIDANAQIYAQGTPYSDGQFNTEIPIGVVLHQNRSTINGTQTFASLAYGWKQRSSDFIRAFGPLKLSGLDLYTSSSLGLTVGSGTAWSDGRNYTVDPNNPSYITDSGTTVSKIFRYRQSGSAGWVYDTNAGAGYTTIDPSQYSNNGVLTSVGAGNWSIQRVYWFPNSVTKAIYVYYGNAIYPTEAEAIANLQFESFVEAPNTAAQAVYLGAIVISGNGVFTNTNTYKTLPAGLFRSIGGTGGGGSSVTTTLAGLSDVNISAPSDGQALVYNTTSLKWENKSFISASISGNAATATSASFASTASFVQNAQSASYVLNAISSSFATRAVTASYADNFTVAGTLTAQTIVVQTITSSTEVVTGSTKFGTLSSNTHQFTGSVTVSGSLNVDGPATLNNLTGSLFGTASWANNAITASNALTASYVLNAISASFATLAQTANTASYVLNAVSASFAANASSSINATRASTVSVSGVSGNQEYTFVLVLTGSSGPSIGLNTDTVTGVIYNPSTNLFRATNINATGSLLGTSSFADNATTASYVLQAVSASFASTAVSSSFATNAANANTASYVLQAVSASFASTAVSASFATTASYVLQAVSASFASTAVSASFATQAANATTASYVLQAVSASFASTASFVNTLNQNVLITGSLTVGQTTLGSGENTLVLGAPLNGGAGEGGQILLASSGSLFPSASMLDNYQNRFRVLRGSNAGSDAEIASFNMHTGLVQFNRYTGSGAFPGTAAANLAVDASGNIITVAIGTVTSASYAATASIATSASFASTASFVQNAQSASYVLQAVSASFATSASNALTASYVLNAVSASFASTASYVLNAVSASFASTASYVLNAVSASYAATASSADDFTVRGTLTAQTIVVQTITSSTEFVTGSTRFGSSLSNTHQFTGSVSITGSLAASLTNVNQTNVVGYNTTTGQLFYQTTSSLIAATASFATSASFASTASFANSGFDIGISEIQTATVASSIVGANNLFTTATGSFTGAKYLYTVSSGSNARMGEVFAIWNGGTAQFTDVSTVDIGSTTAVTASVTIVTAQAQLNFQTNTSGWTIKSQATFI